MGDAEVEIDKQLPDGVWKLVLLAHDESMNTANDEPKALWVLEGEQPIMKKGVSHGSHQSDVTCSTHGWLNDARVQIEYGKNYDGFWNGQMFVDQVFFWANVVKYYVLIALEAQRENNSRIWETAWSRISSSDHGG